MNQKSLFLLATLAVGTLASLTVMSNAMPDFGESQASSRLPWQSAKTTLPPKLIAQVKRDYPAATDIVPQLGAIKLQSSPEDTPLFLINTALQFTQTGDTQPHPSRFCGVQGCLVMGYIPDSQGFQPVFAQYLDDLLPPDTAFITPVPQSGSGLPCLDIAQLQGRETQTTQYCFNGQTYSSY